MNIYHVTQNTNNGYDTYSDFVVVSESEKKASGYLPDGETYDDKPEDWQSWHYSWTARENVKVVKVGVTDTLIEGTVICASFHAG